MNKYWLSWYAIPSTLSELGKFELTRPWWITGSRGSDNADTICAAILAESEDAAMEAIYKAYDNRPSSIEFRFVEQKDANWSPFNGRFGKRNWMKWEAKPNE